ncbi:MAG TPA: hypothetical protein VFG99_10515 [Chloroflexia bacterium]|nr:hypothetical protein [Chloroflexia bacterium]
MLSIRSSSGLRLSLALILLLALLASRFTIPAVAQTDQETDQEGESGESDQSGQVLNEGDNSNQCVAVQPVSNTGDAITDVNIVIQLPTGQDVKQFDIEDVVDLIDELDLDLEDIGSTIELSPEQAVECAQAVDQAASAANEEVANEEVANEETGYCTWYWYPGWWCYWSTDGTWWYYGY